MAVSNVFQVSNLVINDLLKDYANSLKTSYFATSFDRFNYASQVGDSMRTTYPLRYEAIDGLTYNPATQINNTEDRYETITLNILKTVPISYSGQQISFYANAGTYDKFFQKFVNPMVISLGNNMNRSVVQNAALFWTDSIGDPTQGLNGIFTMTAVNAMFANMGLENGQPKYMGVSPNTGAQLQQPYATYFNSEFNGPILKNNTNNLGEFSGVWVYRDNDVVVHTNGTWTAGGNITVTAVPAASDINDASVNVALTGFTAGATGRIGDLIYFQDATTAADKVDQINPLTYDDIGNPKTFVLIDAFTTAGATETITVYPPMVITGPYRNVSRALTTNDKVVLVGGSSGKYTKNMCFIRDGLQLANPKIATYPLIPAKGKQLSAFPYEETPEMLVPETDLSIAFNLASQGDIALFANTMVSRIIAGSVAFNGYGFMLLSAATGNAP